MSDGIQKIESVEGGQVAQNIHGDMVYQETNYYTNDTKNLKNESSIININIDKSFGIQDDIENLASIIYGRIRNRKNIEISLTIESIPFIEVNYNHFTSRYQMLVFELIDEINNFIEKEKNDFKEYGRINRKLILEFFKFTSFDIDFLQFLYNQKFRENLVKVITEYTYSEISIIRNDVRDLISLLKRKKIDFNYAEIKKEDIKDFNEFISYCKKKYFNASYEANDKMKFLIEDYNNLDYRIAKLFIQEKKDYSLSNLESFITKYSIKSTMIDFIFRGKPESMTNLCELKYMEARFYDDDYSFGWHLLMELILNDKNATSSERFKYYGGEDWF